MDKSKPQANIERVSERAGVTPMTISRYFKSPEKVSESTRLRIANAIDELGYVSDSTAARLAGKTRPLLAVVAPSLTLPYVPEIIEGVSRAGDTVNAALMVLETRFDFELQEARIEAAISWRPDGIIFLGDTLSDKSKRQIAASGIQFVECWASSPKPVGIDIGFSHLDMARELTQGLISAGYRNIAFGVRCMGYRVEEERRDGYLEAIAQAGLEPHIFETDDKNSSFAAGAALLRDARANVEGLDATFFAGDLLAAGALFECQRCGISVPKEIAIAGFGDYPISSEIVPSLTTVSLPTVELGYAAAARCIPGIPSKNTPLEFRLVERNSARLSK